MTVLVLWVAFLIMVQSNWKHALSLKLGKLQDYKNMIENVHVPFARTSESVATTVYLAQISGRTVVKGSNWFQPRRAITASYLRLLWSDRYCRLALLCFASISTNNWGGQLSLRLVSLR